MNALFAPESKSFSRSYLEILRFSPDITRRTTLSDSPAEYPNGQNRDDGLQIGFLEKRFGLRTGLHFRGIGTKGSPLEIGIPHRDLRLVGTARRRPRPCHRLLTGDRCRLPGGTGIRTLTIGGGEIGNRTSRSNSRVLTPEHRACSHNPRKRLFGLNSLILNGLTQLDDFRTRSGKNGEYGPNRE